MQSKLRTISLLLAVISIAAGLFVIRQFVRDRNYDRLSYTQTIQLWDTGDTTNNALSALKNAAIHEQRYIVSGNPAASKAYADSVQTWQDESGTLGLVAENERATPQIKDFSQTGNRILKAFSATIALYDGGAHDKALESVSVSAGDADLNHAEELAGKIQQTERKEFDPRRSSKHSGVSRRYIAATLALLVLLNLIAALLLFRAGSGARKPAAEALSAAGLH